MRVNEQQLSAKMWMDFTNSMSDRTSHTRREACRVVGLPHCRQNTGAPAGEEQGPAREGTRALGAGERLGPCSALLLPLVL